MKHKQGFSLVEVMIVVAIIGILTAISLPLYNRYVARSYRSEMLPCASAMVTEIENFRNLRSTRLYPAALDELDRTAFCSPRYEVSYFTNNDRTQYILVYQDTVEAIYRENFVRDTWYATDQTLGIIQLHDGVSDTRDVNTLPAGYTINGF
ncbi:type IV pilin protein [Acanthopleuribacter pedis]|uniref:Pilin n=1 Tax=Acanthopleuribacter pedis TaxID=442870 RepID=A0A8J7QMR9_9BACT|nr:pilin [Acanthopleuribacter pedis]MBO1320860.1 pilin [Acanthopleuribacter pedis]